MNEFVILNELYPKIENIYDSNQLKIKQLMEYIKKYSDIHSDILLSTNMSKRLIFSDKDKQAVYDSVNMDPNYISSVISKSEVIKSSWIKANNPFYVLCILIMRYFLNKNKKDYFEAITVYLNYVFYTSAHKNSFRYLPNKECMDYTINNLSNRFIIKQTGSIYGMIRQTAMNAVDNRFNEELLRCSDLDINNILSALDTRISSNVIYIAKKFYENHASGKYMFHSEDNEDENDFYLADNVSFQIDRLTEAIVTSIITEGFDQNSCIRRSISLNSGASAKKLEPMINTIIEKDIESIRTIISYILVMYIHRSTSNSIKDVKNIKFISEMLQIYKSNSNDELLLKIKEKLEYWINITADKYGKNFISRGKTSLDTYKRAIYTCIILKIMHTANS